jgi:hypothetical protein
MSHVLRLLEILVHLCHFGAEGGARQHRADGVL